MTSAQREIVVIGASAGGVDALQKAIAALPPELPAAVFVVMHVAPARESVLAHIVGRISQLPVSPARDGEPIERGHVYVAPPDVHMLVGKGRIRLTHGP